MKTKKIRVLSIFVLAMLLMACILPSFEGSRTFSLGSSTEVASSNVTDPAVFDPGTGRYMVAYKVGDAEFYLALFENGESGYVPKAASTLSYEDIVPEEGVKRLTSELQYADSVFEVTFIFDKGEFYNFAVEYRDADNDWIYLPGEPLDENFELPHSVATEVDRYENVPSAKIQYFELSEEDAGFFISGYSSDGSRIFQQVLPLLEEGNTFAKDVQVTLGNSQIEVFYSFNYISGEYVLQKLAYTEVHPNGQIYRLLYPPIN